MSNRQNPYSEWYGPRPRPTNGQIGIQTTHIPTDRHTRPGRQTYIHSNTKEVCSFSFMVFITFVYSLDELEFALLQGESATAAVAPPVPTYAPTTIAPASTQIAIATTASSPTLPKPKTTPALTYCKERVSTVVKESFPSVILDPENCARLADKTLSIVLRIVSSSVYATSNRLEAFYLEASFFFSPDGGLAKIALKAMKNAVKSRRQEFDLEDLSAVFGVSEPDVCIAALAMFDCLVGEVLDVTILRQTEETGERDGKEYGVGGEGTTSDDEFKVRGDGDKTVDDHEEPEILIMYSHIESAICTDVELAEAYDDRLFVVWNTLSELLIQVRYPGITSPGLEPQQIVKVEEEMPYPLHFQLRHLYRITNGIKSSWDYTINPLAVPYANNDRLQSFAYSAGFVHLHEWVCLHNMTGVLFEWDSSFDGQCGNTIVALSLSDYLQNWVDHINDTLTKRQNLRQVISNKPCEFPSAVSTIVTDYIFDFSCSRKRPEPEIQSHKKLFSCFENRYRFQFGQWPQFVS